MTTSTTKVLRNAREAVQTALTQWQGWTEKPRTIIKSDDDVRYFFQQEANVSRCPILNVSWAAFDPRWWVFTQQEWRAPLTIELYVPMDRRALSEDMIEDVIDAVYRFEDQSSSNAVPVPYVRKAVGGCEFSIAQIEIAQPIETGEEQKHKMLRSAVTIQFVLRKDPKLRAS